jgi:hypothetical protein
VADLENAVNWNGDPQPNAVQAIANATGISFETLWTFLANARLFFAWYDSAAND